MATDLQRLHYALGADVLKLLEDPNVSEIMLNPDGKLFFEHQQKGMLFSKFMDAASAQTLILTVAGLVDFNLKRECPIISAEIPYNHSRFEALLPPLVKAPCFCIRKHSAKDISLKDLALKGFLTANQCHLLEDALKTHQSLLISGPTSCGKTTLIKALLDHIADSTPSERLICIEDTRELDLRLDNSISLLANEAVSISTLLRSSLRLRPDRIVLGEVRGAEALDLLDALCTGHRGGIASIHAGSISQTLKRLVLLVSRHPRAPRQIEPLIADAVELVVQLTNTPKRRIVQIARLKAFDGQNFIFESIGDSI